MPMPTLRLVVDEQLPPALAPWITANFEGIEAVSLAHLNMLGKPDHTLFREFAKPGTLVLSKDDDWLAMVRQWGPPPQLIKLSLPNCRNTALRQHLADTLPQALAAIRSGSAFVLI